ncbi:MAG: HNH endonuclease family protein [Malacoplasma sp.]|nr:HNH endonuclease family protein [Malacoplasma sp.]
MNRKEKVWKYYFGDCTKAVDAFGVEIFKDRYVDENINTSKISGCWTIDHIFPLNPSDDNVINRKGSNSIYNLQPLSFISNQKKGSRLNGKVGNITYAVKIIEQINNSVVGKMMVKVDGAWYWAYE